MEGLEQIVSEHRLFQGLGPEFVNLAAGCAKNVRFNADQYLFHAEDPADWIYLIGRVSWPWRWRCRDGVPCSDRDTRRRRNRGADLAAAAVSLGL